MESRCLNCGKLLFKVLFISIQIKCPRCGRINNASATECHTSGKSGKTNNR